MSLGLGTYHGAGPGDGSAPPGETLAPYTRQSGLKNQTWRRTWCWARGWEASAALALLGKPLPAVGFGVEEGPLGTLRGTIRGFGQDVPLGSGPRSILRHPPPAPGRLTKRAGPGTLGKAPGSRWAKRSSNGGRLGLFSCLEYRGGSSDFSPGTCQLHSLKSPRRSSPSHEAPHSNKSRTSRAVSPCPDPIATATKWRTREKRRAPPPWSSALYLRTRGAGRYPHRRGPSFDVSKRSQ